MKKLIVFDLDGTLAESKTALDAEMAVLLRALLATVEVVVMAPWLYPKGTTAQPPKYYEKSCTNPNLNSFPT